MIPPQFARLFKSSRHPTSCWPHNNLVDEKTWTFQCKCAGFLIASWGHFTILDVPTVDASTCFFFFFNYSLTALPTWQLKSIRNPYSSGSWQIPQLTQGARGKSTPYQSFCVLSFILSPDEGGKKRARLTIQDQKPKTWSIGICKHI